MININRLLNQAATEQGLTVKDLKQEIYNRFIRSGICSKRVAARDRLYNLIHNRTDPTSADVDIINDVCNLE